VGESAGGGKRIDSQGGSTIGGGSLKVPGVTLGAKAILLGEVGSTGTVQTSWVPVIKKWGGG
jgi:hypothetical protein